MNGAPDVRRLDRGDAAAWWDLRLRMLEEAPDAFLTTAAEVRAMSPEARDERWSAMTGPDALVLGLVGPNGLDGAVGMAREGRPRRRHLAEVWGMYVAPERRGTGAGRALLVELIRHARTRAGLERLRLGVVTGNAVACGLYTSLGFREYGVEPASLKLADGRTLDERLMELRLDE